MGSRGLRDRESRDREVWGQVYKEIESKMDRKSGVFRDRVSKGHKVG